MSGLYPCVYRRSFNVAIPDEEHLSLELLCHNMQCQNGGLEVSCGQSARVAVILNA